MEFWICFEFRIPDLEFLFRELFFKHRIMKKLPKSIRKYIRKEKARIRREVLDLKEQEKLIRDLYQKILTKSKIENKTSTLLNE